MPVAFPDYRYFIMSKRGGDRKLSAWYIHQSSKRSRVFLTAFMSSESSKNTHLNHSEVLVAYNALEASKANNQNLVI